VTQVVVHVDNTGRFKLRACSERPVTRRGKLRYHVTSYRYARVEAPLLGSGLNFYSNFRQ